MKKMIFPILATGLMAVSCSKKEEPKSQLDTETTSVADSLTTKTDSTATTAEKVSLSGTYAGTIPCADCSGIESKLTLNDDKSFVLESNYLGKKDGKFTDKGSFEVSEDGAFITLKDKGNITPQVYHIATDAVYLVTKVGDKELKPEYKLVKK